MSNKKGGNATSTGRIKPPLKWHVDGGKWYLAPKIVALMPPHTHYVEPFAGGLSVLLAKTPEGVSEVANDLHGQLTNFWDVVRVSESFERFHRMVEATPFSELEWQRGGEFQEHFTPTCYPVESALAFFVRCRQSLAGRMRPFTGVTKTRTRRGMNNEVSAWLSAVEGLPAVHERLKRVMILNRDALEVIRGQDGEQTLFYLDPPYLHETRQTTGEYEHEMTADQHTELLDLLIHGRLKGKVMISGYRSELYDRLLNAWTRHDFEICNAAASGKVKRKMTECVWANFDAA